MHMYSLGMTLFWGADYEIPQSQVSNHHAFFQAICSVISHTWMQIKHCKSHELS